MTRAKSFKIQIINPQDVYYAGQTINGQVVLRLQELTVVKGIDIQCKGWGYVSWTSGVRENKTDHSASEVYMDVTQKVFPGLTGSAAIPFPAGDHKFPFSFTLPAGIPSSFERGAGFVRYFLKANIQKDKTKDKDKCDFIVGDSGLDLNTIGNATNPIEVSDKFTTCCWCCASNPVTAKLRINRMAYVPGENIVVDAEIKDGAGNGVTKTQVSLLKRTWFTAGTSETRVQETLTVLQAGEIAPGGTATLSRKSIPVPSVPSSFTPGFSCSLIKTEYVVELSVDVSGSLSDFKIPIEIVIGTVPIRSNHSRSQPRVIRIPLQTNIAPPSYEECTQRTVTYDDDELPQYTPPDVPIIISQPVCIHPNVLVNDELPLYTPPDIPITTDVSNVIHIVATDAPALIPIIDTSNATAGTVLSSVIANTEQVSDEKAVTELKLSIEPNVLTNTDEPNALLVSVNQSSAAASVHLLNLLASAGQPLCTTSNSTQQIFSTGQTLGIKPSDNSQEVPASVDQTLCIKSSEPFNADHFLCSSQEVKVSVHEPLLTRPEILTGQVVV